MSSNNHSFTIRDERLEWDPDDPWSAFESPEASSDGDGEGDTVVKSSERRRTLIAAGEGALAGGLLGALVATVVTLSSASGAPSPQPVAHPAPAHRSSSAVVLVPTAPAHETHPAAAHKTHHSTAPRHKQPRTTHPHTSKPAPSRKSHTGKARRGHSRPAATARIHYRPQPSHSRSARHNHRHPR